MRIPIPGGGKGGIGGIILAVLIFVLVSCLNGGGNGGGGSAIDDILGGLINGKLGGQDLRAKRMADAADTGRYAECETGADANESHDCARVAIENSLTNFWNSQIQDFRPEQALVTFEGSVTTGCGAADSTVGPFYCPADETIYYDTTFFDQVLEQQLGGPDGGFVEFYVLAHEYGHHISNILGFMGKVRSQDTGPTSDGVRLELQADCYAGLWTAYADGTTDASGEPLLAEKVPESDIRLALEAARTVGDDYIQQRMGGRVDAESWTHGSSDQREHWFMVGYNGDAVDDCDTFSASESEVLGR